MSNSIPDPLAKYLRICCNPNSHELLDELRGFLTRGETPETQRAFRYQLSTVIRQRTMTPELYKQITGDNEYTTDEQVQERMREIWATVYGDTAVSE